LKRKSLKCRKIEITVEEDDKEEIEMSSVTPLNGAPTSAKPMVNARTKSANPQSAFLKKLYN
jgi:hypothetical protein